MALPIILNFTYLELFFSRNMGPRKKTRKSSGACYGPPADLTDTGSLYTLRDVLAGVAFKKLQNPDLSESQVHDTVEKIVRQKFLQANPSLPLITPNSVIRKIQRAEESVQLLEHKKLKSQKKKNLLDNLDKLFDLVTCQCKIVECEEKDHDCSGAHIICDCDTKVPDLEAAWLRDQRNKIGTKGGNYVMAGVDKKEAKFQKEILEKEKKVAEKEAKKAAVRAKKQKAEEEKETELDAAREAFEMICDDFVDAALDNNNNDGDFEPTVRSKDHNQNRVDMDYFIAEVVRYGWSDRAAAAAYNAALKTVGIINDGDDKLATDKSKIRRARDSFGAKQNKKQKENVRETGGLRCIGADGKRDKKTKQREVQIINGAETVKVVTKCQEHIVYTREPPGSYLTHSEIAPNKGTGKDLADDFLDILIENHSDTTIEAVVCDGTYTNTGWKDGMLAHLERKLKQPTLLLWLICQAHGNELPMRALFSHCDEGLGTSGPESFKGPLGQACCGDVHLRDVVQFVPINTSLPNLSEEVWKDLSRDQQLLYRYTKAIQSGIVSEDLARQVAGPVNHSRWLTLAIRQLQLYTRTTAPTSTQVLFVTYLVQVYSVLWFSIKSQSKFTKGPLHLFKLMSLVKSQPQETQEVVMPAVQRNAYYAHPSTMLCSMLESEDMRLRSRAVRLIQKARERPTKKPRMKVLNGVRKFKIPTLQWGAKKWVDIIDWDSADSTIHEPTILTRLDNEELNSAITTPIIMPEFPVHSQSVERGVKLVSEAATKVVGQEKRHQHILSIIESRAMRAACDTKKDFKYKSGL